MAPELTSAAWTQIRYDYEHTERPIAAICAEHGISSGTLRDRMRRWGWTRRRPPIPRDGPPPLPAPPIEPATQPLPAVRALNTAAPPPLPAPPIETAAPLASAPVLAVASPAVAAAPPVEAAAPGLAPAPSCTTGADAEAPCALDAGAIVPRLQSAVARVLPAIETIVARLGAGATHPREMEHAGRALSALTRTLRELNGLLSQRQAPAADHADEETPEDMDEFRRELARRMNAVVAARTAQADGDA